MDRVKAAVAKVSRLLGKPTDQLPAHLPYLMRQLNRSKHQPGSPQRKTVANTKSEIRYLIRTIIGRGKRSEFSPLSPIWADLKSRITGQSTLWKLSRFIAYCSIHGIAPDDVSDQVVEAFRAELIVSGDVDKPEQHVRATVNAWNRTVTAIPCWPDGTLYLVPQHRKRWTINPVNFAQQFNQDVQRWLDRLGKPDQLSEDGPHRALRPVTIQHRAHQIFKASSALVLSGFPIEKLTSLKILIQPENFQAALQYLLDRQGGATTEALFGIASALKAVATHHVKAPQDQLNRLRRISIGLKPEELGLGLRTEQRLEPFEDDRILAALLHLPQHLIHEAERPGNKPRYAKILAQVAIAIEIELFAPLRLKNLTHLNLSQHIQIIQQKGKKTWVIRIDRQETKNRSALTYILPFQSVALIERALRLYRQPSGWLFPGVGARPKSENCLSNQIKRTIENRLGVRFNVHLFRSLCAVLHLKANPNGFESVRAILGDRDDQVIRRSYTGFAERHLIAAAQDTILKSRARTAPAFTVQRRRKKAS